MRAAAVIRLHPDTRQVTQLKVHIWLARLVFHFIAVRSSL